MKGYAKQVVIRLFLLLTLAIIGFPVFDKILTPLTFYLSYLTLFYANPQILTSTTLIINEQVLRFVSACTATGAYLLLAFLILLTKDCKKPFLLFFKGAAIILIANLIRIHFLIILLLQGKQNYFETLHVIIWQLLSTLFVAGLWIYLTKKNNIKTIPIYDDIKTLVKNLK